MATPIIKTEDTTAAGPPSTASSATAGGSFIKTEPGSSGNNNGIKAEGVASPMSEDDEQFEDSGDLDMSKSSTIVWMVKLPDFIVNNWDKIDEDEEIHLANVRVYEANPEKNIQQQGDKVRFFLTDNPYNDGIPKMYDMVVTDRDVKNTYVFTEKDMPGFNKKPPAQEGLPAIPARLLYPDRSTENRKFTKGKPFTPFVRRAIPKRTSLVGTVKHEATVTPVDGPEYTRFLKRKRDNMEAEQRKKKITVLDGNPSGNLLNPGTLGGTTSSFDTFIKPQGPQRRPQEAKASRMPKNELLDALFECFGRFEYWSLKGLREELNQPESYLKETLESVATLLKNGPFALKWTLKPEYKRSAPEPPASGAAGDDDGDDDDDDEGDLEDVNL